MAIGPSQTCTWPWPPTAIWRAAFRKQYSHSSSSKWYQFHVDVSCVLLGLKSAFLVDYVNPSVEKLKLFLKDVNQLDNRDGHESADKKSCGTASEFSKCLSRCCILSLGEDTLLLNMDALACEWDLHCDQDHRKSGDIIEHAQSTSHRPLCDTRPIYVDITKGLAAPKLLQDKERMDVRSEFLQWLKKVYSAFLARDTSSDVVVVSCPFSMTSEIVTNCLSHDQLIDFTSQKADSVPVNVYDSRTHQVESTRTAIDQNGCTLFGQLLGYPVVYWFNCKTGYTLDAVELVCYTVLINSMSDSSLKTFSHLNVDQV